MLHFDQSLMLVYPYFREYQVEEVISLKWQNQSAVQESWSGEISNKDQKEQAAGQVSEMVKNGDVIGVGSGSTSYLALKAIAARVQKEGLDISAIPTSHEASLNCATLGLKTTDLMNSRPDWGFDGADEVDTDNRLIKGRGGAMFAEKLVMASSPKTYILVDGSKFVSRLGEKFALPIELDPRALHLVETKLKDMMKAKLKLRMAKGKDGPVITESGNLILDMTLEETVDNDLENRLRSIPGVIETGLFIGYPVEILTV
ncbi:ribose-5-phosphate isomerase [Halobacillus alkaliphilus]|uniref:Ribose 5-phosphate isomerase A n=1 Tax=Halobacillus alkaliphilus TaxID=396056 RepID=A0A1I2LTE8_9BACI|nr:ribose-5-phosphate isomerase [Halobacillus alkaliphilus]